MWLYIFLTYEHCKLIDMSERVLVMVVSSWHNALSSPGKGIYLIHFCDLRIQHNLDHCKSSINVAWINEWQSDPCGMCQWEVQPNSMMLKKISVFFQELSDHPLPQVVEGLRQVPVIWHVSLRGSRGQRNLSQSWTTKGGLKQRELLLCCDIISHPFIRVKGVYQWFSKFKKKKHLNLLPTFKNVNGPRKWLGCWGNFLDGLAKFICHQFQGQCKETGNTDVDGSGKCVFWGGRHHTYHPWSE